MPVGSPARRLSLLFALFESGGNVPPILTVAGELRRRGHDVRVLAPARTPTGETPRLHAQVRAAGCRLETFDFQIDTGPEAPPLRGLLFGRVGRWAGPVAFTHLLYAHAPAWAVATRDALRREPADAVAADHMLPGALAGAEACDTPAVALLHTIYIFRPAPGIPPYGPGFWPSNGLYGRLRDGAMTALTNRVYRRDAVPWMNLARRKVGLGPLEYPFEEYDRIRRVLVMASPSLDLRATSLPPNVRYTGMPFDPPSATSNWQPSFEGESCLPLVLVSFSTQKQGQDASVRRVIAALGERPVRAIVALGGIPDSQGLPCPVNVRLVPWVPHDAVMPRCQLVITHGGHGTVMKALSHGVPLLCLPTCCDQPDIAVRVAGRGLGLRLSKDAPSRDIGDAVDRLLGDPRFRSRARRTAARLARENGRERTADEIEAVAGL